MSEWQPIETAPRSGAELAPAFGPCILLSDGRNGWGIGYWIDPDLYFPSGKRGWISIETHRPFWGQGWTHWMPLPEPPQ